MEHPFAQGVYEGSICPHPLGTEGVHIAAELSEQHPILGELRDESEVYAQDLSCRGDRTLYGVRRTSESNLGQFANSIRLSSSERMYLTSSL